MTKNDRKSTKNGPSKKGQKVDSKAIMREIAILLRKGQKSIWTAGYSGGENRVSGDPHFGKWPFLGFSGRF